MKINSSDKFYSLIVEKQAGTTTGRRPRYEPWISAAAAA
jgi:hypothetical protein